LPGPADSRTSSLWWSRPSRRNTEAYEDAAPNAISTAYENGDREMCDLLASYGASISPADFSWKCDLPILSSMLKSNPSIANELLSYNDESKPEKSTMINLAFKYGADPQKVGQWALYRAYSAPMMLKAFLEHGVDPNTSDREGKTTLHAMAGSRDEPLLESAELLLTYGADINAKDEVYKGTPLAWAAILGKKAYVAFLLDKGAKTNLADDESWTTPLFWAEYKGHAEIAEASRGEVGRWGFTSLGH
jgi:hypothetical protein